jgi:GGDEF domain-containing protein
MRTLSCTYTPESTAVVVLCALGLVGYPLGVGQMAWQRYHALRRLRRLRQELRASEAPLQAGNETLVMLDIDHFKAINDTHGHQVGDEVLRRMSELLTAPSRQGDIPCRIGGEEFLLLLHSADAALYAVKRSGRNGVCLHGQPQPESTSP